MATHTYLGFVGLDNIQHVRALFGDRIQIGRKQRGLESGSIDIELANTNGEGLGTTLVEKLLLGHLSSM